MKIDSKYYDTEKKSSEDLDTTKNTLKGEIDKIKELINAKKNEECNFFVENLKLSLKHMLTVIVKIKISKMNQLKEKKEYLLLIMKLKVGKIYYKF